MWGPCSGTQFPLDANPLHLPPTPLLPLVAILASRRPNPPCDRNRATADIPSPLSFRDVARLITVDPEDESVTPNEDGDDPLGEELVDAAEDLGHTERSGGVETSVSVTDSIAALFDSTSREAKALKPRHLFLNFMPTAKKNTKWS